MVQRGHHRGGNSVVSIWNVVVGLVVISALRALGTLGTLRADLKARIADLIVAVRTVAALKVSGVGLHSPALVAQLGLELRRVLFQRLAAVAVAVCFSGHAQEVRS